MDQARNAGSARRAKPRRAPSIMLLVRQAHLYIGVFLAPAILFFAFTGLLQVYSLHQSHGAYQAPPALMRLAALHKDQTSALRQPKGAKRQAGGASEHQPDPLSVGRQLLKAFAAAVAVGLIVSTLLGLYMAYAMGRNVWLVNGLLAAGVLAPLILIVGLHA